MCDGENIRQVTQLGVDWIGMIFYPKSPRHVPLVLLNNGLIPDQAKKELTATENVCQRVGVFVDEMPQTILTCMVQYHLDVIQMHGHESPTLLRNLRKTIDPDIKKDIQIWKAISVEKQEDILAYKDYADCVDAFVFDTKCPTAGGSGQQFDWQMLEAYDGDKPFLLSGGIGPDDAERVRQFHHPRCMGIDLNSRFETKPGFKNIESLKAFLSQL